MMTMLIIIIYKAFMKYPQWTPTGGISKLSYIINQERLRDQLSMLYIKIKIPTIIPPTIATHACLR